MLRLVASVVLLLPLVALGVDGRTAVEGFVARLAGAQVSDVAIEQTFTLYHPDSRHPKSTGEQRVWIKVPRRQRVEQVVEGRREVRLAVADQVWIRAADGRVYEAPPAERERERTHLLMPFLRTAGDVLAEWRPLGIRDDASHETRGGRAPRHGDRSPAWRS